MAISRMQEPRQLYGLGSLVRKITRPIKKAVKGIGKIAKSPLGKTALLGALGAYGLGALGSGSFNPLTSGFFSRANLGKGLGAFFSAKNPLFFKGGEFSLGRTGLTAGLLGAALPFIAPNLLKPKEEPEEEIDLVNTPASIAALNQRARDFYNFGDPDLMFMPQQQYVMRNFYAADGGIADLRPEYKDGGRIGFRMGSDEGDVSGREYDAPTSTTSVGGGKDASQSDFSPPTSDDDDRPSRNFRDDINKLGTAVGDFNLMENIINFNPKGIGKTIFQKFILDKLTEGEGTPPEQQTLLADAFTTPTSGKFGLNLYDYNVLSKQGGFSDSQIKNLQLNPDINTKEIIRNIEGPIFTGKEGGSVRAPKKQGGLMDLGGLEMDFRAEGGFVPIGAKEKADDVPARLSKNEFVMTADAVRGAGKGSIKAGAQKMYNTMKELERRVV